MRYGAADTVSMKQHDLRYLPAASEKFGFTFCTSAKGTGVNLPENKPESRFGDAAEGRGNCINEEQDSFPWVPSGRGRVPRLS